VLGAIRDQVPGTGHRPPLHGVERAGIKAGDFVLEGHWRASAISPTPSGDLAIGPTSSETLTIARDGNLPAPLFKVVRTYNRSLLFLYNAV
jgi:hypothetical protein